MIYIGQSTSYIYINLFERGMPTPNSDLYTLTFTNEASKATTTFTSTPTETTKRYFKFYLNNELALVKDGFYSLSISIGGLDIYTELVYLSDKIDVTYNSNLITTTYAINEPS